jgi:hypothetical protein
MADELGLPVAAVLAALSRQVDDHVGYLLFGRDATAADKQCEQLIADLAA